MRKKEVSKILPRFVTWAAGRLMVSFMEPRKGADLEWMVEFNYR